MGQFLASIIGSAVSIYALLILAAVIFSWIRPAGRTFAAIRDAVASLTEPYLRVFRRLVPPLGRFAHRSLARVGSWRPLIPSLCASPESPSGAASSRSSR